MSASRGTLNGIQVAIVSANAETLTDLESYFGGVGVRVTCGRTLDLANELPRSVAAIVIFPDDYLRQKVIATVETVLERSPEVLPVLVTAEPSRYRPSASREDRVFVIVSRPVWAWAIYDAVRPQLALSAALANRDSHARNPRPR